MIIITATTESGAFLPIGRQGEHGVRQIWFDLTWLIEHFGEGAPVLVHQRIEDLSPYPVPAERIGNNLVWKIDETDTAFEGVGRAEIRWTVDNADDDLGKTVIYKTNTLESLTAQTEIPDPIISWYEKLLEQIGDSQGYAEQAAQSAEAAEAAASTAAADAVSAVLSEVSGYTQQAAGSAQAASQSSQQAAQSASRAESAKQAVLSATVTVTPLINNGNLTFNATIEGGD